MTMRRSSLLLIAFIAACGRDKRLSSTDSADLARDLAMANAPIAAPQFQDTALGATPETKRSRPTPTRSNAPRVARVDSTPLRSQRPAPSAPAPAPEPEPAPVSRFKGFGAGTNFALATKTAICTTNLPGDKIVATLTEPVTGENGAYLPAGTTVVLEVVSVTPGETPESAQISLRVRSIDINEQPTPVDANVMIASALERREVPRNANADRRKVVGGAIAGAVIGQIMGRDTKSTVIGAAAGAAAGTAAAAASRKYDACLPAGGSVRVTTTRQIALGA